jgi:hypothetical protein
VCGTSPGAEAAKSRAMTACSGQWDTMKKADRLPKDQTWAQFWSQCSKDFAAKKGTDATAAKSDTSQKASDTTPKEPKIKKKEGRRGRERFPRLLASEARLRPEVGSEQGLDRRPWPP